MPSKARPNVIAGLKPFEEISALEVRTPTKEPKNWTSKKSAPLLSLSPHLVMNTGSIGPIKEITIPLTTKPAQSK